MITHEIIGDDMQAVVITLAAGEEVRAEAGAMTYMTDGIEMDARMNGGLLGGLKRKVLAGESLFLTFFRSHVPAAQGRVQRTVSRARSSGCRCRTARCSASAIRSCAPPDRSTSTSSSPSVWGRGSSAARASFSSASRARATSSSTAAARSSQMELKAGEKLRVDTGCLSRSIRRFEYDIEFVGGIKTALFGGEGLFFATMTGPGRVWIQTLPFSRLADRILAARRGDREDVKRDFGGTLGAIGDLIGGE